MTLTNWGPWALALCASGWLAFAVGQPAGAEAAGGSAAPDKEPRYLLFWRTPDKVPALVKAVGTRGDGRHILGFGVPCPTMELEKQVPALIRQAFAAARANDVALMLHYDFHIAWRSRPDLWNWLDPSKPGYNPANRDNVEWFGWDGPPAKVRYLNHGVVERMPPSMCFTSKRMRREWTRLVSEVIAPTLRQEIAALKREGKDRLFAGVLVGSEPMFDNYMQPDTETAKMIAEDGTPRGRACYRALMDRGFSKAHPPAHMAEALNSIIQETVAFWCRLFAEAGIPAARLYPHVAPQMPVELAGVGVSAAFNRWSRPGWSTYAVMGLENGFRPLYSELRKHGSPPWGGVEANAGFPGSVVDWETYLGWHYNHGAALVAVNVGATGTDLPSRLQKAAFGPDALAAYRKFLRGGSLKESALPVDRPEARLQSKMMALQAAIRSWQDAGRDPRPIVLPMEQRLTPLVQKGAFTEAAQVIDEALKRLRAK